MTTNEKKRLRQRVIDVLHGAGMRWLAGDNYFEYDDGAGKTFSRAIQGLEKAFDLPEGTALRYPCSLDYFDNLSELFNITPDEVESRLAND